MERDKTSLNTTGPGPLDAVGPLVRDALAERASAATAVPAGRARFLDAFVARNQRRAPRWRSPLWLGGLSTLATAAVAAFFLWPRPLSFSVDDQDGALGQAVEALRGSRAVAFSDGSQITLDPSTRLRVVETQPRAVRVRLDKGRARISVRKSAARRWRFEAGAFTVNVLGTRFEMSWDESRRAFDLTLTEGRVLVESPCLPAPRYVSTGERLQASCPVNAPAAPSVAARIQELPAPSAAGPDPSDTPPAAAIEAPPAAHRAAPPPKATPSWHELAAGGRYAEAMRSLDQARFESLCRGLPALALTELGDSARLARDAARADHAFHTLRARFPGTLQAAVAAFSLGRLTAEQRRDPAQAADWFERYLREQPSGALAGDAWGRLLEARAQAGQHARARADAERYLRLFPTGPFAALARRLAAN